MELILQIWTKSDGLKFKHYSKILSQVRSNNHELKIVNTQLDFYYIPVKDKQLLSRRMGVIMLFYFIKAHTDYTAIFNIIKSLKSKTEYYVNMALAWLLAECFITQRDQTLVASIDILD